jgi:amino acid adenylation domain-containing protein
MADGVLDLPLRMQCESTETHAQLLKRVRSQLMDALDQPLITQGRVARTLGIRSTGDRPALTGVFFNLNPKVDVSGFAPLSAVMKEGRKQGTLHDLFFNFYDQGDTLTLDLHYSADFFSPQRAAQLVRELLAICEVLSAALDGKVGDALPALEQSVPTVVDPRLLAWNATTAAVAPHARVEQWVTQQALVTPDAPAIETSSGILTYRDLESRSNRFANLMRSRGIGANSLVGLCMSRGADLVPALLGVLKAGAAYVPLDPGFPRDRLHYMANDAEVALVVTESAHGGLSGIPRERQLRIDDDAALINSASDSTQIASPDIPANAPMYVIYTSGSTGKPKGVVLPQNAVCNFLASMRKQPGLSSSDRLLAVTTLSFDIAVLELLLPLTVGAAVVIAQREEAMDGEVLGRLITERNINVMQATPTTWHMLLDAGWRAPQGFKALCGGEPLPPLLAAHLLEQGIELWNMYGPTETTVWSTLSHITDPQAKITIGRPIDNTQVWILDDKLHACPVGAEGEICIGGNGVAIGYFKRPELTAERFVQDPFNSGVGRRLYRTGDLGRWREDGTIEHLGRLDFQVKIRGYRIELGEIEAQLAAQPGITRTVVVAREDSPGDIRLIGYAVAHANANPQPAQLREALRASLPDYMLPQQIILLDTLPLLPNGKIDRKALPAPTGDATIPSVIAQPPQGEMEHLVAQAMQAVLKLPAVGRTEDFFSLGGHSLLAAKLIGQLNKQLNLQLNLRVLFESPTVEKLALVIDQYRDGGAKPLLRAAIAHRADQTLSPLTLMQERIRFMEEMHPGRVTYNAPSAHRLTGPMDVHAFRRAFTEMVQRQPVLRSSIVATQNGWAQRAESSVPIDLLPMEDLSGLPRDQREAALRNRLEALTAQTFDLAHGPLFKARLLKLAEEEHALFFMPHHIIWDGWSFDIFYTEISALYEAYLQGKEASLPPLQVTYGDFSDWHQDWLKTPEILGQIDYWKKQFSQGPLPKEPLADRPRPKDATGRGTTEWMHLSTAQAERIRDLAKRTGSTLSIVALSMYAAMMSQWLGDKRPSIGIPVRGRPSAELEAVMGFFNNLLPLRLDVDLSLSCLDWIGKVRQAMVDGFANQDVPFELLAHELQVHRGGSAARLYQVMFSFQDARARQTQWGPLHHERILLQQKGATEDINLWMVEIPGGIEGGVQYNADLFLPSTAKALRDRFLAMLESLTSDPHQSVAQILAAAGGSSEAPAQNDKPIVMRDDWTRSLDTNLSRYSSQIALQHEAETLTYAELARRMQACDAFLSQRGATCETTVEVATTDAVAQIVASLAALRRGSRVLLSTSPAAAEPTQGFIRIDTHDIPGSHERPSIRPDDSALGLAPFSSADVDAVMHAINQHVQVLETDRVLTLGRRAAGRRLALAALAFTSGGTLMIADRYDGSGSDLSKWALPLEQFSIIDADITALLDLLERDDASRLSGTVLIDVQHTSPTVLSRLFKAGLTAMSVLHAPQQMLPVALGWLENEDDSGLVGDACSKEPIRVVDTDKRPVPIGVVGMLQLQRDGRWIDTTLPCRIRSDGVLQYLGEITDPVATPVGTLTTAARPDKTPAPPIQSSTAWMAYTPTQRIICEVWSSLLGTSDIRLHDNFFELGGTSLLAMQASLQLEQRLRQRVSARRYVFETLGQLAAAYDGHPSQDLDQARESGELAKPAAQPTTLGRLRKLVGWS